MINNETRILWVRNTFHFSIDSLMNGGTINPKTTNDERFSIKDKHESYKLV